MSLISEAAEFTYRGEPASMVVIRNNGYCWGRFTTASGTRYDVTTRHDWYDYPDEDASDAFIRASRNPKCVDPTDPGDDR